MNLGLILSLSAFLLILTLSVYIRMKRSPTFEIKSSEIFLALLPILLYGLFSGKIQHFEIAGVKVDSKFKEVINTRIEKDILPLKIFEAPANGFLFEKSILLRERYDALKFVISEDTSEYLICDYLDSLSSSPTLKYVIFTKSIYDNSEELIGLIPINKLIDEVVTLTHECDAHRLAIWIKGSDINSIKGISGFISSELAASPDWEKRKCLKLMLDKEKDVLPVISKDIFLGVIEKSHLVASLIVDFSSHLDN